MRKSVQDLGNNLKYYPPAGRLFVKGSNVCMIMEGLMKLLIGSLFLLILVNFIHSCKAYVRSNIFPAPGDISVPKIGNDELIEVRNSDRIAKGLLSKKGNKIVIIFHGNGSTIANEYKPSEYFYLNNFSILLVEYPGYGISKEYKVSEENIYADSEALIMHIMNKYHYEIKDIYLYGRSLGAAVAVEMAKRKLGSKLILITPFTSMVDAVAKSSSKEFAEKNVEDRFDNMEKAKNIVMPTLIIHGKNDKLVPYEMGVSLSKEFKNCRFITMDTDEHRNIYNYFQSNNWKEIADFLMQ